MSTKDFFKEKKIWSKYKDILLGKYLKPYFQKILFTERDTYYIDCFAGKGKFDDGEIGSPIIAKNIIEEVERNTKSKNHINCIFIDKKYAEILKDNLNGKNNCEILKGDFKNIIPNILQNIKGNNVFLYVDPFGIKKLDFVIFSNLKKNNFYSIELFLNFNSFGFLREGCRLLNIEFPLDISEFDVDNDNILSDKNDIKNMNNIANGNYWQSIIMDFKNDKINIYQAEELFFYKYTEELNKIFSYVLNIPIKLNTNHMPKYRMIFATNHIHGVFIMADNMIECNKEMSLQSQNGQFGFFDYDYTKVNCRDDLMFILKSDLNYWDVKSLYYKIYKDYGLKYQTKDLNYTLKNLENEGAINIKRTPYTTKTGKISKSMDFLKNKLEVKINGM